MRGRRWAPRRRGRVRAISPVSYQVDTLAFGVKHTPKRGCYALQTLGHVPVIFIWNKFLMDDAIKWSSLVAGLPELRFCSLCLNEFYLGVLLPGFTLICVLAFRIRRWPLPGWEWLNCAPTHRVAYAFGDKHHQKKMVIHYRNSLRLS